ncbi:MAG: KH domain-containing protein [Eubacterium sp.]|nr:KH domain-containing protein [Eubacterium sp.]
MTELVETIAKALVDNPDEVMVSKSLDSQGDVLTLKVAGSDMGKVIGKKGRIAKALRTVVKAAYVKQNKNVLVEIISDEDTDISEEMFPYADGFAMEEETNA